MRCKRNGQDHGSAPAGDLATASAKNVSVVVGDLASGLFVQADLEWQQIVAALLVIPLASRPIIYNFYIHLHPFCDIQWCPALY